MSSQLVSERFEQYVDCSTESLAPLNHLRGLQNRHQLCSLSSYRSISLISSAIVTTCSTHYPSVCVIYEYLVTFSSEVDVMWRRKSTTSTSIMFFLNRYNTLFYAFFTSATGVVSPPNVVCLSQTRLNEANFYPVDVSGCPSIGSTWVSLLTEWLGVAVDFAMQLPASVPSFPLLFGPVSVCVSHGMVACSSAKSFLGCACTVWTVGRRRLRY